MRRTFAAYSTELRPHHQGGQSRITVRFRYAATRLALRERLTAFGNRLECTRNGLWFCDSMSRPLISKKTRQEFREYFVGTTLRQIEMAFDAADVPFDGEHQPSVGGERRSLVEQYYHAVDWHNWTDVRKVLEVYENVLVELSVEAESADAWAETAGKRLNSLVTWLRKDGYEFESGKLILVDGATHLEAVIAVAARFDAPELHRQLDRIRAAVDEDPGLAIGTAKELLETTCKTILHDRAVEIASSADISELVKETRRTLELMPEDIPESARGAQVVKRLLSNLGSVAQGLAELRNLYGTGHGRHGKGRGPGPRHARLAVGAAAALATFLFETHEERP